MVSDNGHLLKQDDSALDYGGPGYTWCGRCKAVYGTPAWAAQCPVPVLSRKELKQSARLVRMWKGVAKRLGLPLVATREEDEETGLRYHGFECEGLGIVLIDSKWYSAQCRHYGGNLYEPPSWEWETRDTPLASFGDALEWLVREAHNDRLACAIEDAGQWLHWAESAALERNI